MENSVYHTAFETIWNHYSMYFVRYSVLKATKKIHTELVPVVIPKHSLTGAKKVKLSITIPRNTNEGGVNA